jgi:cytochrome P450
MRTVTEELTDRFAKTGHCEFMADFADHYPARIACELLGVPLTQQHSFRQWTNDIGLVFSPDVAAHQDRIEAALAGLFQAVDALIEAEEAGVTFGIGRIMMLESTHEDDGRVG